MTLLAAFSSGEAFASAVIRYAGGALTRPFSEHDYGAVSQVRSAVYPDSPLTDQEMRFQDDHKETESARGRRVLEIEGHVVGIHEYRQVSSPKGFSRFSINLQIHPDYQKRGLGSLLYEELFAQVNALQATCVTAVVRDDHARALQFLQRKGFEWRSTMVESWLDVSWVGDSCLSGAAGLESKAGVSIKSLAELKEDPTRDSKVFALLKNVVPGPLEIGAAIFVKAIIQNPQVPHDAYLIALRGDEYVGLSSVFVRAANRDLVINMTGVLPDLRRQGIAKALKVRQLQYARRLNFHYIKTNNAVTNGPIRRLNIQLGFRPHFEWFTLARE